MPAELFAAAWYFFSEITLPLCLANKVGHPIYPRLGGRITSKRAALFAPTEAAGSPNQEHTGRVTPSEGVHCGPPRLRHEKSPLNFEAFNGPTLAGEIGRSRGPTCCNATKKSGSGGLAVGGPVEILFRLKDNAVVELGERQFDANLR